MRLGSRALEILTVLIENAGEIVGKAQLMMRVWPHNVVEEAALRVHMAALRKILGDGRAGRRFITTVPQRGYSFVAPVREHPTGPLSTCTCGALGVPASSLALPNSGLTDYAMLQGQELDEAGSSHG